MILMIRPSTRRRPLRPRSAASRLTPYSYERLDSLRGYEAGMPNPGFYHRLWQDREAGRGGRRTGRSCATWSPCSASGSSASAAPT